MTRSPARLVYVRLRERPRRWTSAALLLALLAGAAPAQEEHPPRHDVVVEEASLAEALRLVAEVYDLSLATGPLPAAQVSLRLRQVTADEALRAVAGAHALEVERRGDVLQVRQQTQEAEPPAPSVARRVVAGPFGERLDEVLPSIEAAGLRVERLEGAVFVEGSEERVAAAVLALETLRAPKDEPQRRTRVFHLGLADGEEAQAAAVSLLREDERAVYDESNHSLIVTGSPETLAAVADILEDLEGDRPQVEIEARVIEARRGTLERLGAEWNLRLGVRGGSLPTTAPLRDLDDSLPFVPSPAAVGTAPDQPFVFSQLDAQGFSVFLELLQREDEARILASPRVTALHNRPASVRIGRTLRIPTFTQNPSFNTSTVSGIETVEVGTRLDVRPRLSSDGRIYLRVEAEMSEVDGAGELGLPIVSARTAETEVVLRSGETLFVGGLIRHRERERLQSVPFVGRVPILGRLFQHRTTDHEVSELLVFLTPRRLPSAAERAHLRRVGDLWLPIQLAEDLARARLCLASDAPRERLRGLRLLEDLDPDAGTYGLDPSEDARELCASDPSFAVRAAAVAFLLRRRPASAFADLTQLPGSRDLAVAVLDEPLAPHLRLALGESLGRTAGGVAAVEEALRAAQGDPARTEALLRALSAADPAAGGRAALELLGHLERRTLAATLDALSRAGDPRALEPLAVMAREDDPEASARALTALALGAAGGEGRREAARLARAGGPALAAVRVAVLRPRPDLLESALAWAGPAQTPLVEGDVAARAVVREALALLSRRAPDYRHLVNAACARVVTGATRDLAEPERRTIHLAAGPAAPERIAHRLVHLAHGVLEARVLGLPAAGPRALAAGVREEVRALERLTGAACPEASVDLTVRSVLVDWKEEHR